MKDPRGPHTDIEIRRLRTPRIIVYELLLELPEPGFVVRHPRHESLGSPATSGFTLPNVGVGIAGFVHHPAEGRIRSTGAGDDVHGLVEIVRGARRYGP